MSTINLSKSMKKTQDCIDEMKAEGREEKEIAKVITTSKKLATATNFTFVEWLIIVSKFESTVLNSLQN